MQVRMHIAGIVSGVLVFAPFTGGPRSPEFHRPASAPGFIRSYQSFQISKLGGRRDKLRSSVRVSGDSNDNLVPIAPLQFESSVGQLLEQVLQTNPHLFPTTIDQQLESLRNQRDNHKEEAGPSPHDLLYKRIAEVKEKEEHKTLEEIIYCLIVHEFVDRGISMIPKISAASDPTGWKDFLPSQEQKLESVHSLEVFEMVQSHLSLILGERLVDPLDSNVRISKIKLGKLYAASIMYGYFLKRVDERFKLERSMETLPEGFTKSQASTKDPAPANKTWDPDSLFTIPPGYYYDDDSESGEFKNASEGGEYQLRSYVMYLDADTLQRYATIRSKEAISLIEKQTQALFGRPDIRISKDGSIDTSKDEAISTTFSGLTMLVLEAVAFGSFLWDAESYAEIKCHFLKS